MEVAAALTDKAHSVSVIGIDAVPFRKALGEKVGKALMKVRIPSLSLFTNVQKQKLYFHYMLDTLATSKQPIIPYARQIQKTQEIRSVLITQFECFEG